MTFVSYAQNFEDYRIWRALKNIEKGFYIDIGAWHPIEDSVSQHFYLNGWRGINIEPDPISKIRNPLDGNAILETDDRLKIIDRLEMQA